MFIDTERVAVRDDRGNTIYVRRKMDFGAVSRIQGAPDDQRLIALYVANIVGWEGPDFQGVPCTAEHIARLDPNDPMVELIGNRIAELNPQKTSPKADSPGNDGSTNGGAPNSVVSTDAAASPTP